MNEGSILFCTDNVHKVVITKILNYQSIIIECYDKQLSFTKLIDIDDINNIRWETNSYLLRER